MYIVLRDSNGKYLKGIMEGKPRYTKMLKYAISFRDVVSLDEFMRTYRIPNLHPQDVIRTWQGRRR